MTTVVNLYHIKLYHDNSCPTSVKESVGQMLQPVRGAEDRLLKIDDWGGAHIHIIVFRLIS